MFAQLAFMSRILQISPLFLLIRFVILTRKPGIRHRTTLLHELGLVSFGIYLSCVCSITVNLARILQGQFAMGHNYNLTPFAEITGMVTGSDPLYALLNIAGNVILFFPFGLLLPLLWCRWNAHRVFLLSLFLSTGIEALQLFTGRSADIDDVILNTLGSMVGFLTYCMIRALCPGVAAGFRLHGQAVCLQQRTRYEFPKNNLARSDSPTPESCLIRRADARPAKHGCRFHRTAFVTTLATLLVLVPATALLSGFSGYCILPSHDTALTPQPRPDRDSMSQTTLDIPAVNSANILLACADMSQVLYNQNAEERVYPASLTKMMTAILALECIADLEEVIPLRWELFTEIRAANLSTAGFQPGEEVRACDLVYGVMLPSGAECSVALAEHIAGSEKAFALLMNEKADELGMTDTHFINATGSHHANHYSTARDMALLLSYALENPVFREIAALEQYHTSSTNLHPEGIDFASTLFSGTVQTTFPGGALSGGKTGYTDEAGQCLASFARIGSRDYILVTAGARPEDFRVEQLHIEDAIAIYGALGEIGGVDMV